MDGRTIKGEKTAAEAPTTPFSPDMTSLPSAPQDATSRRLATAITISRIRWVFIPLALVGVPTNVPPPVNLGLFLATIALVIAYNAAITLHSKLPGRAIEPLIFVSMLGDVVLVTVTMYEFARDPTDLGWAFLMLVGPAAAVLYGWRGVRWFGPLMVAALFVTSVIGDQFAGPNGVVGFLHKALEILGVTIIVAALAEQNERQRAKVEQANRELERLAVRDALTGIANRRLFETRWADELARAARTGKPLAVAIADIDQFKQVNDRHGHPAGDEVLRVVAADLELSAREIDLVARIGGEEFAFVLPNTDDDGAKAFGDRIQRSVAALDFGALDLRCTISVGVASSASAPLADLLVGADRALYRAKAGGRHCVEAWHGEIAADRPQPSKSASMRVRFDNGETVDEVALALNVSRRVAYGVYKRWQLAQSASG